MAFFNFLKKFKRGAAIRNEKFRERQREKSQSISDEEAKKADGQSAQKFYASEKASSILVQPHITEKSTKLSDSSSYIFRVHKHATKPQIKKAVSELYRVGVESVNMSQQKAKVRFTRRIKGYKPGYKKATVTLRAGEKIEFI